MAVVDTRVNGWEKNMQMRTAFTDLLGVRVPLMNAPMTPQAGPALARAVCAAGAFGMLGFDEDASFDAISADIQAYAQAGPRVPFGIGLVDWVVKRRPEFIDLAIAARPTLIGFSFGDPTEYMERFHQAGILVATQVQNRRTAQQAINAGVDFLVAQGSEAGGHTGTVGTLPLLQMVLEMTDKPVIAAGGIVTGRGLAAVLAAGAVAAWIGTPFLLARESRTATAAREAVIQSDETQTIYTSVFDRLQNKGWTSDIRGRAIRNGFSEQWHGREEDLMNNPDAIARFRRANAVSDFTTAHIYAGQSVGLLSEVRSAADIVKTLEQGAINSLRHGAAITQYAHKAVVAIYGEHA